MAIIPCMIATLTLRGVFRADIAMKLHEHGCFKTSLQVDKFQKIYVNIHKKQLNIRRLKSKEKIAVN